MSTEPTCNFDCWTLTSKARNWLHENKATELHREYGFIFYENPFKGQDAPVLAVRDGASPAGPVWNTEDFDLPTSDPLEQW